jgi:hypothetical protein
MSGSRKARGAHDEASRDSGGPVQPATPTLAVLDLGMVSLSDLVLEAARKMDLAFWMVVAASILLGAVGAWLCDT